MKIPSLALRTLFLAFACVLCADVVGAVGDPKPAATQEHYIATWQAEAVAQMQKYGIPASITLAQGILESGNGVSELAQRSNNHFGIKCHSTWTGKRTYHDDDEKGECFRVYDDAKQSYEDHSQFLLRDRYARLFELEPTDYKGWAKGLKACGYATNPKYANLLITLIERHNLQELDVPGGTWSGEEALASNDGARDVQEAQRPGTRRGAPRQQRRRHARLGALAPPADDRARRAVRLRRGRRHASELDPGFGHHALANPRVQRGHQEPRIQSRRPDLPAAQEGPRRHDVVHGEARPKPLADLPDARRPHQSACAEEQHGPHRPASSRHETQPSVAVEQGRQTALVRPRHGRRREVSWGARKRSRPA